MLNTSVVYNNEIMDIESFINAVLYTEINLKKIPSCNIKENSQFYSITLSSFYKNNHTFQIYYKNSFLILQIKLRDCSKKILSTRMFFLPNIDINTISHTYYSDSVTLKILKIYNE